MGSVMWMGWLPGPARLSGDPQQLPGLDIGAAMTGAEGDAQIAAVVTNIDHSPGESNRGSDFICR
jgi:hypothetical protein